MTPADATEQVVKLLRPDLPVSRRIQLRETTKAAFEADGDVLEKIKPFLITIIVPSAHDSVTRRENALEVLSGPHHHRGAES